MSIEILETGNIAGAQSIASLAAADASVKGVKYILEFLDKNGEAQLKETSPRLAPLVFGKPTLAPEGLTYKGIHEGVQFSWAGDVKVAYSVASGGQEVSFVPRNVAFFLIDRNSGPLDIEAQIVDLNEGNHQDTACRVEYFGADVGCSLTCADAQEGALVYLKSSQSNSAITTKVISNNSVQPTGKMIGLTPDQEVVVWAQYEGGTQQSACTAISPISTRSLTEENGAEPGKQVDPRCFIATAAWGSTLAPEVNVLRWLRDAVLLRLPGGESLVAWYYAESPVWAAELERQPWIKPYVRAALWPVVVLGWTLRAISPLWSMLAVYVLLCLAFIFVLYRVRKLGQW
ncbi:MAG: hypothetical protein OXT67_04235 [Zetaproteobacteria bacterium]|nr:hypothetical protein [Zetaproteobacteria bacterium]